MGLKFTEKEILATEAGKLPENRARIQTNEEPKHRKRKTEPVEKMTGLEKSFLHWWRVAGGDPLDWLFGQKIFPERPRMHVDFYNPEWRVAVEIDGGQWAQRHGKKSGHSSGTGLQRDAEKLALCNRYGIALYRMPTSMVSYEEILKLHQSILKKENES